MRIHGLKVSKGKSSSYVSTWKRLLAGGALCLLAACGGGGGGANELVVSTDTSGGGVETEVVSNAPSNVTLIEVSSSAKGALTASWMQASDQATLPASLKYQLHASVDDKATSFL